jgi:hypothetical protein
MNARLLAALLPWAALCATADGHAASGMQPGMWEITTRVDMPGMPATIPPQIVRHCYTPKDVEDGKGAVSKGGDNKNCQVKDYQLKGSSASWAMECKGENAMTGTGTITFGASAYNGTMKMKMQQAGKTMDITQAWSGKRVGDCK